MPETTCRTSKCLKYGQTIVERTTDMDELDSRAIIMKYIFTYKHRRYCLATRLLVVIVYCTCVNGTLCTSKTTCLCTFLVNPSCHGMREGEREL